MLGRRKMSHGQTLSRYVREYPQCLDSALTTLTAVSGSITEIDLPIPLLRLLTRNAAMEVQQAVSSRTGGARQYGRTSEADTLTGETEHFPEGQHLFSTCGEPVYESHTPSSLELHSEQKEVGPLSIQVAARLRIVLMDQNALRSIVGVVQFCNVHFLSLRENDLERIEDCAPLSLLPHLTTLSLEGNPVVVLPNFRAHVLRICAWPHRLHERSSRLIELNGIPVTKEEIEMARVSLMEEAQYLPLLVRRLQLLDVIPAAAQRFVMHQQLKAVASRSMMALREGEEEKQTTTLPPVLFFRTLLAVLARGGAETFLTAFTERGRRGEHSLRKGKIPRGKSDLATGPLVEGGGPGRDSHWARQYIRSHLCVDGDTVSMTLSRKSKRVETKSWEPSLHHSYLSSCGEADTTSSCREYDRAHDSVASSSSFCALPKMYQRALSAVEEELHNLCVKVFELLGAVDADFDQEILKELLQLWCDVDTNSSDEEESNESDKDHSSVAPKRGNMQYYDTSKSKNSNRSTDGSQPGYMYKRKNVRKNNNDSNVSVLSTRDATSSSSISMRSASSRRLVQSPFASGISKEAKPRTRTGGEDSFTSRCPALTPSRTALTSTVQPFTPIQRLSSMPTVTSRSQSTRSCCSTAQGHSVGDSASLISCDVSSLQNQEEPQRRCTLWNTTDCSEHDLDHISTAQIEKTRTHNEEEENVIGNSKAVEGEALGYVSEEETNGKRNNHIHMETTTVEANEHPSASSPSLSVALHHHLQDEAHCRPGELNDISSLSGTSCFSLSASSINREQTVVWSKKGYTSGSWREAQIERYQRVVLSRWRERFRLRHLNTLYKGYCQAKVSQTRYQVLGANATIKKLPVSVASLCASLPLSHRLEFFFRVWRQRAEDNKIARVLQLKRVWNAWKSAQQEKLNCREFEIATNRKLRGILFQRWRYCCMSATARRRESFISASSQPSVPLTVNGDLFQAPSTPEMNAQIVPNSSVVGHEGTKENTPPPPAPAEKLEKLLFDTNGCPRHIGVEHQVDTPAQAHKGVSPSERSTSHSPSPIPISPTSTPAQGSATNVKFTMRDGDRNAGEAFEHYPSFARLTSPQAVHRHSIHPYEVAGVGGAHGTERGRSSLFTSTKRTESVISGVQRRSYNECDGANCGGKDNPSSPSVIAPLPPQRTQGLIVSPIVSRLLVSILTPAEKELSEVSGAGQGCHDKQGSHTGNSDRLQMKNIPGQHLSTAPSKGGEMEETFFDEDVWFPSSMEQHNGLSITRSATPAPTDLGSNFSHKPVSVMEASSHKADKSHENSMEDDVWVGTERKRESHGKVSKKHTRRKSSNTSRTSILSRTPSKSAHPPRKKEIAFPIGTRYGQTLKNEPSGKEVSRHTKKRCSARASRQLSRGSRDYECSRESNSTHGSMDKNLFMDVRGDSRLESSSSCTSSFSTTVVPCPYPAREVEALIDKMEIYKHTIAELRGNVQSLQSRYECEKVQRQSLQAQLKEHSRAQATDLQASRDALKRSQEEVQHLRGVIDLLRRQRYQDLDLSTQSLPKSFLQQRSRTSSLSS